MSAIYAQIKIFACLLIVWLCMSGVYNFAMISLGVISSVIVSIILYAENMLINVKLTKFGIMYVFKTLIEIFQSSLMLCRIIWSKKKTIKPCIKWVNYESNDVIDIILRANAITMTPGTIVIAVDKNRMLVHAINRELLPSNLS